MKKITNREEANLYYKRINELIDNYIKTWKIRPSEIHGYFNRNMDSFLEKEGLFDVQGIRRIVNDVLDHRKNMELDRVIKFESFKSINEGALSLSRAGSEHEKVLSDYYGTSLGHVDILDPEIHLYKIEDFGEKVIAIIFSEDEIIQIKEHLISDFTEEVGKKIITINSLGGTDLSDNFRFWVSDIIDSDVFRSKTEEKLTPEVVLAIITDMIKGNRELPKVFREGNFSYKSDFKGWHIWECR